MDDGQSSIRLLQIPLMIFFAWLIHCIFIPPPWFIMREVSWILDNVKVTGKCQENVTRPGRTLCCVGSSSKIHPTAQRLATSLTSHRPVSQHLYLRQHQQLHIPQDAEHPADEKGQREERQERDQERKRCEVLQDWWQVPRQSWVDCKLCSENCASLCDEIFFHSRPSLSSLSSALQFSRLSSLCGWDPPRGSPYVSTKWWCWCPKPTINHPELLFSGIIIFSTLLCVMKTCILSCHALFWPTINFKVNRLFI